MLPANATLLVIDVQHGFGDPAWRPRNNPDAEIIVAAWRRDGCPIRHVHHSSRSLTGYFFPGTTERRPKPEAIPAPGEPIHLKSVNSAFSGTDLDKASRSGGVDMLVVGPTTNYCVSTVARMAGNFCFATCVVADATAAFDRMGLDGRMRPAADVHAAALSDLSGEFATIVRTEELLGSCAAGVAAAV